MCDCPRLEPEVLRSPALLEFLQMLPERPPRVLCPHHATLLEQRHDLLHERADRAGPQPLPDRKSIAANRLHGAGHTVGDALRVAGNFV